MMAGQVAARVTGRGALVVTRPEPEGRATAAALGDLGRPVLVWPLTAIRPTGALPAVPAGCRGLLFTSANGVRAFAAASARRDLAALCVGARTAAAARDAGFGAVESAAGDAAALARLVTARADRDGPWLHVRGREAAGDLAGRLAASGARVAEAVLYAAEEVAEVPGEVAAAFAAGGVAILGVWSPRNAAILARRLEERPEWPRAGLRVVAISARAAAPLEGSGCGGVSVAEAPSGLAMLAALRRESAAVRR